MKKIEFEFEHIEAIEREDGRDLYFITLPIFHGTDASLYDDVKFVIDTGCNITRLTNETVELLGFNKLPEIELKETNVVGSKILSKLIRIPCIGFGNRRISTTISYDILNEEEKQKREEKEIEEYNLLGLNLLEYFNFYIDFNDNKLYLKKNDLYEFYWKYMSYPAHKAMLSETPNTESERRI